MSRRANKFFIDNWFSKTIIRKNKDKIKLLANTISDELLKEIIILNIILLVKTRKTIARESGATNYGNHYSVDK